MREKSVPNFYVDRRDLYYMSFRNLTSLYVVIMSISQNGSGMLVSPAKGEKEDDDD